MSQLLLSAESGRKAGTRPSRQLRREGKIPAVVYGLHAEPLAVSVEWPELRRAVTTDAGLNALITLEIDGEKCLSVIKQIHRHPVRRDVLHVDFLRVTEDQPIDVNVPLVVIGEARNVTMYDGMVDQNMYELTISVKPTEVPRQIEIDISNLELGETIKVADVPLPAGATTPVNPEETVAIALITRSTREAIRRAEAEAAGESPDAGADAAVASDDDADASAGDDDES
jgi:large subunit ribosomal protein L25